MIETVKLNLVLMKFIPRILTVLMLFLPFGVQAQFAGGSGTEGNPYQIETIEQLQAINNLDYLDKHFIQIADIDASVTAEWNDGKGFEPIGDSNNPFTGSYDGGENIISNLFISRSSDNIGLFGYVEESTIERLGLESSSITGENSVGIIIGYSFGGEVLHSFANGIVEGNSYVGAISGFHEDLADSEQYGNGSGRIYMSYAHAEVIGEKYVGGLLGLHSWVGTPDAVLDFRNTGIIQSFTFSTLSGDTLIGGLAGASFDSGLSESYWDIETDGSQNADGAINDHYKVFGLSTEQMTGQNAYIHMYRLDFENTWQLTEGYPVLQWQEPVDAVEPPDVPILLAEQEVFDFGEVSEGESDTLEVSLINDGRAAMSVELSLAGEHPGSYSISGGAGPRTIEVGDTLFFDVIFTPESVDQFPAILQVNHDASNRDNPLLIALHGEGKTDSSTGNPVEVPEEVKLHQNFPNPFNPVTTIRFELPQSGLTRLSVYDILGREVSILENGLLLDGLHEVHFHANTLSSGMYLYRLQTPEATIIESIANLGE